MASNSTVVTCDDPLSLVCKLCDKTYQHKDGPLMLPCLHSFCKPCLTQYIEKEESADDKMSCPTCNDRFPHPEDINQFPVNLRLSHLASTSMSEWQGEGNKIKREMPSNEDEETTLSNASVCCNKKNKVVVYCNECSMLVCWSCCQTDHQEHRKVSIDNLAKQHKVELQQITSGFDDAFNELDERLRQIQDTRDKVKVSAKEVINRINKMCDDLIQAVEDRMEALKRKCEEIAEGKDDALLNQSEKVEQMRKKLAYTQLHVKDAVSNHSDDEIVSVKKVIEDRVRGVKQQQSMELCVQEDTGNIGVEVPETKSLVKMIKELDVFTIPDHKQRCTNTTVATTCNFNGLAGPIAIAQKEKKISVSFFNNAGSPVQGRCHFQYQLSKVGEDPDEYIPPKVTITQNNDGTATLGFTPDQPGEYELTIMVRNKPIAIPYKITARESRDYSNFENMPATFENIEGHCYGVAVHDNGTVYASSYVLYKFDTIKVFRPDGTQGQIGNSYSTGGNLSNPRGITIIGDTLYVVSKGNHMVKMYSTDGSYTGGFGGNGSGNGQFNRPLGICTDGNGRVLVADKDNNRIQVFTSDGGFIKSIPCSSHPYDVAVDPVGNIHVALYSNNHIAVYSHQDGRLINTYDVDGAVSKPISIFIDQVGNRLIGCYNNKVIIVDSADRLIASRQVDSKPDGLTVDKSGLIYITECNYKHKYLLIC